MSRHLDKYGGQTAYMDIGDLMRMKPNVLFDPLAFPLPPAFCNIATLHKLCLSLDTAMKLAEHLSGF